MINPVTNHVTYNIWNPLMTYLSSTMEQLHHSYIAIKSPP
jgi:hypothetical protein